VRIILTVFNSFQKNKHFLRKIPANSECANIMVGAVPGLQKPAAAFLRLSDATILGNFTEVPLPTRFLFVLFTPSVREKA
jgi:sodium bicarbonate transporter 10